MGPLPSDGPFWASFTWCCRPCVGGYPMWWFGEPRVRWWVRGSRAQRAQLGIGTYLVANYPRLVSGLVHPSYKWINPLLIPCKSLGWTNPLTKWNEPPRKWSIDSCGSPLPSGKRLHSYGKSPCWMGKSISNGPFSIAMLNYQRVTINGVP